MIITIIIIIIIIIIPTDDPSAPSATATSCHVIPFGKTKSKVAPENAVRGGNSCMINAFVLVLSLKFPCFDETLKTGFGAPASIVNDDILMFVFEVISTFPDTA